jgi:hemerythrin-like metal-binding protein
MAFLNWKNQYSVKVAEFDEQHKNLFSLINSYMESVKKGNVYDKLKQTIHGLEAYADVHFRLEEEYMLKYEYPDYSSHKEAHQLFTTKVGEFKSRLENGDVKPEELGKFLMDWLVQHIMGVDRNYSSFFNEKGVR